MPKNIVYPPPAGTKGDVMEESSGRGVFAARLAVGLLQGLVLYGLYYTFEHKDWPATQPLIFTPLALVALYVPLMVIQAAGNLHIRVLVIWTAVASVIAAGFAFYDIWHGWPAAGAHASAQVVIFTAVFLFVSHALISCVTHDRKIVPDYCTLFDVAWKQGVQLVIAACFVGAFWIVIWLGVALFEMIKLHFFREFIQHSWFAIPVTALAAAAAIHITDVRANLVRGVRTLALMLLSWLLPIIALIAFVFLISLVFTGLKPLWETRTATALLLTAAAVLVILINAAYQDGDPERRPHHVLRVAGTLASIELIFIVAIAAYALWLRVDQYGWTVDRIDTAAVTLVAACFAVGYFIAALLPSPWLKLVETWNFLTTIVGLAVLFVLFTPIADPLRISVNNQMARLKSGAVKPASFDYAYLRWHGGRFGHDALVSLSASEDKAAREAATAVLTAKSRYAVAPKKTAPPDLARTITVHPEGRSLPTSFVRQDWSRSKMEGGAVRCLEGPTRKGWSCDAVLRDFDGDGIDEVLLIYGDNAFDTEWYGAVLKLEGDRWVPAAMVAAPHCKGERKALESGQFSLAPPPTPLRDIVIGGRRTSLVPFSPLERCH